jgi:hypothetical protein
MGPDEGIGSVNNSNYVNVAAMMVLQRTIHCHDLLTNNTSIGVQPMVAVDPAAVRRWQAMLKSFVIPTAMWSGKMVVLPFDGADPTNATVHSWSIGNLPYLFQHGRLPYSSGHVGTVSGSSGSSGSNSAPAASGAAGGARGELDAGQGGLTQAMVSATFSLEEVLRLNFSSASSLPCRGAPYFACPPIALMAASVAGDRDKARTLLRLLRTNYTLPPFDIMREYSHYNFGMYITHLGSFLSTVYSMIGIEVGGTLQQSDQRPTRKGTSHSWVVRNASFPQGWARLAIQRIFLDGQPFRLTAAHGQRAELEPLPMW